MAVAVPILLSATGASAAIGAAIGVSAGLVTAGAGLLVGATGIGKSINKAAAKVFGEDLVSFTNLAGGIALAAGWSPGETWSSLTGGAGSAGGALSSAPDLSTSDIGIGGASAGQPAGIDLSTSDIGVGGASAGSAQPQPEGAMRQAPSGAEGFRELERQMGPRSYSSDPNAIVRAATDPGAGGGPKGAMSDWWDKQGDRTKAALVTMGGQALAGVAQGYETAKDRAERRRRERVFQSGSGLNNTYAPRVPVQSGG